MIKKYQDRIQDLYLNGVARFDNFFDKDYLLELSKAKNRLFEDEDAVKFWLSDDKNKVPLKLLAKMNFGNFVIEIENYKNVN